MRFGTSSKWDFKGWGMSKMGLARSAPAAAIGFASNRLLATLGPAERALLEPYAEIVRLTRGETLICAGDEVSTTYFPLAGSMIAMMVELRDGRPVNVATIGKEGALGGIVSCGSMPAFATSSVQMPGEALKVSTRDVEHLKSRSSHVRDLFCRYADALLAQIMQSVACNTFHPLQARCCRWLLSAHDRVAGEHLPLTQEGLAAMLGVQRTTVTSVARHLQEQGVVSYRRGIVTIRDRSALQRLSCECYSEVEQHFGSVLPDIKPQKVVDQGVAR
jgi:CRP-like cAMP-binding protein